MNRVTTNTYKSELIRPHSVTTRIEKGASARSCHTTIRSHGEVSTRGELTQRTRCGAGGSALANSAHLFASAQLVAGDVDGILRLCEDEAVSPGAGEHTQAEQEQRRGEDGVDEHGHEEDAVCSAREWQWTRTSKQRLEAGAGCAR